MADFFGDAWNKLTSPSEYTGKGVIGAAQGLAGGVADFFAAKGAAASADAYFAARDEDYNKASLTEEQTRLQEYSAQRRIEATKGTAQAATAAAGFTQSGTALDILRETTQQGYLTQAVIGEQGAVSEAGYLDAAKQAEAEGTAAHGQIFSDILGGVMKVGGAVASLAIL